MALCSEMESDGFLYKCRTICFYMSSYFTPQNSDAVIYRFQMFV